ncbi:MAG: hypothetical protein ACRC68_07230 [Clostridium sp.]
MKKKYDGNVLIESIVSLMILGITLLIAMTSIINMNKSNNKRNAYGEINRVSYSIMNELKYNYSYEEIKTEINRLNRLGSGNYIGIKYSRDILEKLTTVELFSLERSNEIKIEVVSVDNINNIVGIKINTNVQVNGEVISDERSFDKLEWMHL